MKKIVKYTIQVIMLLILAKICIYCGEITGEGFSYGVIWCTIVELIINTRIIYKTIVEDGNETTKRIY